MKSANLLAGVLLVACQGDPDSGATPSARAWLVLNATSDAVDSKALRVEPADIVESTSRQGSKTVLALRTGDERGELRVEFEQACSVTVPMAELTPGAVVERRVVPWLDFGEPRAGVGFDTPVTIDATPGCPEANEGRIEWQRWRGPIVALQTEARGYRLKLRTPKAEHVLGKPMPWGIVPISPRTRGTMLFEAVWRGPTPSGGAQSRRFELEVNIAHRSRGLPNVALGTSLLLAREGWRVVESPAGAKAAPRSAGGYSVFDPDRHGRWVLEDSQQQTLSIHAARFDHTPLDCGRAECHASIAGAALKSPMTSILQRELERGPAEYPACALGCHATGEPGAEDGGFSHVAAEIGLHAADLEPRPGAWDDLPRALRRLGGVGCLACHGPGAIPEPSARVSILRADVCAYCHDAPPRYGHVEAWRSSAMARSDRDPHAGVEQPCARCHTTSGFLAQQGVRADPFAVAGWKRRIAEPIGITCAACHAVHDPAGVGTPPALLRPVRMPTLLADQPVDPKSRVCTPCHTPGVDETAPSASAAALIAGRGGVDPSTGAALEGPAPHGRVDGGCVACHRAGPSSLERGAGHAFTAHRDACRRCHPSLDDESRRELRGRAEVLWAKLEPRVTAPSRFRRSPLRPPHASPPKLDPKTPLGRAARNVLLVLEDPAAAEHNLPYARKLLHASERWIETR